MRARSARRLLAFLFTMVLGMTLDPPLARAGSFPTWDKKIAGPGRFKQVLDNEAVLDRETGLIWEKAPDPDDTLTINLAMFHCFERRIGERTGFRLPTTEELMSVLDTANSNPALPVGHPFTVGATPDAAYVIWTSTSQSSTSVHAVSLGTGNVLAAADGSSHSAWCVRGQNGPGLP
jgi:hypothetical protein